MKHTVPLILTFLICHIFYAQQLHISDFTSVEPGAQDENFNLPDTHTFQYIIANKDPLTEGGIMPDQLDYAGYVPKDGSSKSGYLSVNSEVVPKGGVTILDIEFDDAIGKWIVDKSQAIDFSFNIPAELLEDDNGENLGIGSTVANCSGTVTTWNTIITYEEWTNKDIIKRFPDIDESLIKVDGNPEGYNGYGWAIEIDPATKTVIDHEGGRDGQDKLWALGNFKHENGVINSDDRTVYQGADATYKNVETREGDGYLFKFVAAEAQDLSKGDLYVYKGDKLSNHEWLKLANTTQEEQNTTIEQCKTLEATAFGGIEDVEISPIDGMIYFAVKSEYLGDIEGKGIVYRFKDSSSGISDFEIYVGGGVDYDGEPWGEGNDNLVFDDLGNLWVAQDGSFSRGDNNYIWVVENGHTQANPKVKIFARTPKNSEPTGLTFTPDYRYIFMSIQHPSGNSSSQTDVFGTPVSFNDDVVLVIARNEFLGMDEVLITQYYHDADSESKWIEIKNISGRDIPAGSYSINLFDASNVDIVSGDPSASESIPEMLKDEVILFKNSANPVQPGSSFLGNADQIESSVCNFDDEDVIIITRNQGGGKYINRKDILGFATPSSWGGNKTLIRGGNSSELPEKIFNANKWIQMDSLEEVNSADKRTNLALGTHVTGPAVWNGSSWNNDSPPDRTRNTQINKNYSSVNNNISVHDLLIKEGFAFDFVNNTEGEHYSLAVYGDLDIEGSLSIGDTESLIIKNAGANVIGEIEKIEYSTVRNDPNDMTYWSSPVQGELIENVFENVDPERIFYFDQTRHLENDPDADTYWDVWREATGIMEVAKGYAAEGKEGTTGQHEMYFKGKPNFGLIESETLDFHDDASNQNDYNLIGNPYPSAIDIELFLKTNIETKAVIDGTIYLWTHATPLTDGYYGNDYITYNYVGAVGPDENTDVDPNIGSGQGFFVRAIKSDKVIFDSSMILTNSNNQFFKGINEKSSKEKDRLWLNLKGSDGSFKQILIGFNDQASAGLDLGYDALYLKGGQPIDFYSFLTDSDEKLSIQGRESFHEDIVIDLGFETDIEGIDMQFEIGKIDGELKDQDILLRDKEAGVLHDLNIAPYTFSYKGKGSFKERFSLVFNSVVLGVDELQADQKIEMYLNNDRLYIDSPWFMEQIKIYDIQGRLLKVYKPKASHVELIIDPVLRGNFFIVEVFNEKGNTFVKKMIRY